MLISISTAGGDIRKVYDVLLYICSSRFIVSEEGGSG